MVHSNQPADRTPRAVLMIGALGVVYGDIGTSPLYALRECFHGSHSVAPEPGNVLGIVSLVTWSLILIVTVKYLGWVLRADHKGEGGILALMALAMPPKARERSVRARWISAVGLVGAALLYGDGMLTPAVTVLGAMEGLEVASPVFRHLVLPLSLIILLALFAAQSLGTARVGRFFGPIMLLWFAVLAIFGFRGLLQAPAILGALSPHHGLRFLFTHGWQAFPVLSAVFLAVTGAEALYADLGHFGASPIRRAWFGVVFPGLLLNYFGQGALLLTDPAAARNPFYLLVPASWVLPVVGLASVAAIIASQALISGAFSLTMQAVQLGYLPRLLIRHTSHSERGQVYVPRVNLALMLACLGLVVGFGSSSRLAGAYGIAVCLTMLATTCLFYIVARQRWQWSAARAGLICGLFFAIEVAFALANGLKIWHGGWFTIAAGALVFSLMTTWHQGRQRLRKRLADSYLPLDLFLGDLETSKLHRAKGTAVFMSGNPHGTPIALLHNLRHNQVLHERVIILTVVGEDTPYVQEEDRVKVETLRPDLHRIVGHYGYMEQPNVPELLTRCKAHGLDLPLSAMTFFLSRETILPARAGEWPRWRSRLFAAMSRNAQPTTAYFQLPPNRVVELGMQVEV